MMVKIFKYFLTLALIAGVGIVASAQTAPKKKVAVYMTGKDINENYKKVIGATLVSAINESGEYTAVERTADFLALSAENYFQTSGEMRDSQIAELCQRFGVKFVVVADVSEVFNELFVAARLINVETALVEKSFNANGPAESMQQLIELSKNVANGLFTVLSSSQDVCGVPLHLSLCVVDRKGKTQYITTEQWQSMSENKKLDYTKNGVVIAENGEAFIVAMRDSGECDWYMANRICNLPIKWQAELMFKYKDSLNNALRIFGGIPLEDRDGENPWYWTLESCDSYHAWLISMIHGTIIHHDKTSTNRTRAVATVSVVSAM